MRHLLAVLMLGVSAAAAMAESVTFQHGVSPTTAYSGARDVHLENASEAVWAPDANYRSVDLEAEGEPIDKSTLLRWDLSAIPSAAIVTSASISLKTRGSSDTFELYEVLRPWDDAQATGLQASAGVPWSVPCAAGVGADRSGFVLAVFEGPSGGGPITVSLNDAGVELVAAWVRGAKPNHGFVLQDFAESDGLDFAGMYDVAAPDERPLLTVQFSVNNTSSTLQFRNGRSPTSSYAGGTGTTLACGKGPGRETFGDAIVLRVEGSSNRGALLAFDLTALPRNTRVSAAALKLGVRSGTIGPYGIYPQQRAWTELGAAWEVCDGVVPWGAPGNVGAGDHVDVEVARILSTPASGPYVVALNDAGVELVQRWITGNLANNGVFIHDTGAGIADTLEIYSREYDIPANRPALTIDYDIPVGTIGLAPSEASVAPFNAIVFKAVGGTAPYSWSLSVDGSGASVTQDGVYTAGPNGNSTDKVTVSDSQGLSASAPVRVAPFGAPRPKPDAGDAGTQDGGAQLSLGPYATADFGCSTTGGLSVVLTVLLVAARSRWRRRPDSE